VQLGDDDHTHIVYNKAFVMSVENAREGHEIFASEEFSDAAVFTQLKSLDHQLRLADHGDWLLSQGPCTVSLAEAMCVAKTRKEAIDLMRGYLQQNKQLQPKIAQVLSENPEEVLKGLRTAAESYLSRTGRALPSWGEGSQSSEVPDVVLKGESGSLYRPKRYLARGSAGLVYSAERDGVEGFVLKRVYPTQLDSALNEYKIATRLKGCTGCLSYIDIIRSSETEVWLVLPLISRSAEYGVDLREYIVNGFFQKPGHQFHARTVALNLLEGLQQVSERGIIMRDVKPDNVLIQVKAEGEYEAFWTDFGLAVDLGPNHDGGNLRKVQPSSPSGVSQDLVCWWYDTCKLVPRPKWNARRPPERGFTDPRVTGGVHPFDSYMTGIILACMAIGIDLPHIDQADSKKALETFLGLALEKDYLKTFELGASIKAHPSVYEKAFLKTFGDSSGAAFFEAAKAMLALNPADRPKLADVLQRLR